MIKPQRSRPWSSEETRLFYQHLLEKALAGIPASGANLVLGPMFILRSPEENFALFAEAQDLLRRRGLAVFSQLPYVDYNIGDAPFDYPAKFEIFYRGLIQSGKIAGCYLLPDWEQSEGTRAEVEYCKEAGVPVHPL